MLSQLKVELNQLLEQYGLLAQVNRIAGTIGRIVTLESDNSCPIPNIATVPTCTKIKHTM